MAGGAADIFMSKTPVLTSQECRYVIEAAEDYAEVRYTEGDVCVWEGGGEGRWERIKKIGTPKQQHEHINYTDYLEGFRNCLRPSSVTTPLSQEEKKK